MVRVISKLASSLKGVLLGGIWGNATEPFRFTAVYYKLLGAMLAISSVGRFPLNPEP